MRKQVQIISAKETRRVANANAALWAETYITTESGEPFSFTHHKYQIEPMCLDVPKMSVRKATQGGWTLIMMLWGFKLLKDGKLPQGLIYLFPTDVKVGEFSQLRWTRLLDANPVEMASHVKRTDNIHNKRIGRGNLMMRGAQLTKRIGGVDAESIALRSDPADVLIFDEIDLMPPNALAKARGRLGHSKLKWERSISNPTIPGYGIDLGFQAGDQRHSMTRCNACNAWTCLEIEFPNCLHRLADGRVIRACVKCGREISIENSQWAAKFPSRSKDHVSYWWSQLGSHYVSAAELLEAYEHPPEGNLGDVLRLKIGLPYLDAQYGLSTSDVLLCCTQDPPATHSIVQTAIGVDVGKWLHVVIGYRITDDAYRIIACLIVRDFDELKLAARAFRAGTTCIDNEPELRAARNYQATGQGQIWLSDYVESVGPAHYEINTRLVRVNRTEILDDTHFYLSHPGRLLLPKETQGVRQFAEECASMAKVVTKEPATGKQRAQYLSRGPDHFRHAFANFLLAAKLTAPIIVQQDATEASGSQAWNLFHR